MLIEFKFSNYRSFRDEAVLSMEATGLGAFRKSLIEYRSGRKSTGKPIYLLPAAAIYGKNGGGKSNVIRAFFLAVQFIRNAQRTQHEKVPIPVRPFLLNDTSTAEPTRFEFTYVDQGIKYIYGFAATKERVEEEYLYHSPKGQRSLVFSRSGQEFHFPTNNMKRRRELISEAVAANQLYFAVACTMNEQACVDAMRWFRECVRFSRGYADFPKQLLEYSEDPNMLRAISDYAKAADVGIRDMQFDIKNQEIPSPQDLPENVPEGIRVALVQFMQALSDASPDAEQKLRMGEVRATSFHQGVNRNGEEDLYSLELADESDGTRRLMSLAPDMERILNCGGVLLVDELEKEMHPMLVEYIVAKFQSPVSNPNHAQLIFTTHNTELLNMELLRKDQLYFADKSHKDGSSSLYSISELSTPTSENVRKGSLMGKYGATPDLEIEEVE